MSDPRGHHLVAQFYLRAFARRAGRSWQTRVLDKSTGRTHLSNVRKTLKERDWHTISDADGVKDFGVEQFVARAIEDPAAPAITAMREGTYPLSPQDRGAVAVLLSAQLVRGRFPRQNLSEFLVDVQRMTWRVTGAHADDERLREISGGDDPARVRDLLLNSEQHVDIRPTNALLLRTLFSSVTSVAEMLVKRTWTLVAFRRPCLLTGENPFVHIHPSDETIGYGVATAERMYFPVSPSHGLLLSHPWSTWPEGKLEGDRELAEMLNWAIVSYGSNIDLVLHPDVASHPLPAPRLVLRNPHWPWGEDPRSRSPVSRNYLASPRFESLESA